MFFYMSSYIWGEPWQKRTKIFFRRNGPSWFTVSSWPYGLVQTVQCKHSLYQREKIMATSDEQGLGKEMQSHEKRKFEIVNIMKDSIYDHEWETFTDVTFLRNRSAKKKRVWKGRYKCVMQPLQNFNIQSHALITVSTYRLRLWYQTWHH